MLITPQNISEEIKLHYSFQIHFLLDFLCKTQDSSKSSVKTTIQVCQKSQKLQKELNTYENWGTTSHFSKNHLLCNAD